MINFDAYEDDRRLHAGYHIWKDCCFWLFNKSHSNFADFSSFADSLILEKEVIA